jgi:hypothetical protein
MMLAARCHLGSYSVIAQIGAGEMRVVYNVEDLTLVPVVARPEERNVISLQCRGAGDIIVLVLRGSAPRGFIAPTGRVP